MSAYPAHGLTFPVALNEKYRGKVKSGDARFWDFNMSFQNRELDLVGLLTAIRAGHAWTAPHRHIRRHRPTQRRPNYRTTYRVKENVIGSQLLALDSDTEDERSSFDGLLEDDFIGRYAALLHASASSTPERPRTRVVFVLDEMLAVDEYELALRALLRRFPFCDQSVKHAAVLFYGAENCAYQLPGRLLPLDIMRYELIQPYQAWRERERAAREAARRQRLAQRGRAEQPARGQVSRYVGHLLQSRLQELAVLVPGTGERHQRLFTTAVLLGRLEASPWLTPAARALLTGSQQLLLEAAAENGYIADYGEDDAWRTIDSGLAAGEMRPLLEPVWYQGPPFFNAGDRVEARIGERVVARGRISRFREIEHWEFELDSAPNHWFAHNLLHLLNEEEE